MSAYVDSLSSLSFSSGKVCKLFNDHLHELHIFARELGLTELAFFQGPVPHYQLTESKRKRAIEKGAVELDNQGLLAFINRAKRRGWIIRKQ